MSQDVKKTGIVKMPKKSEQLYGYHAIEFVGYYEELGWYCKNSWGKEWGVKGYFILPWDYLLDENLSMDFWTITMVETT